jgi:hypothetical protein
VHRSIVGWLSEAEEKGRPLAASARASESPLLRSAGARSDARARTAAAPKAASSSVRHACGGHDAGPLD